VCSSDLVDKRENEIAKLVDIVANIEVRDSNPVSPRLDADDPDSQSSSVHDEFSEKVKFQISNAVAEYVEKMKSKYKKRQEKQKRGLDASWEDQIHHISKEMKAENQQRASDHARDIEELTAQILVLRAENELLKSGTIHAVVEDDTEIRHGDALESALGTYSGFRTVKLSVSCRKGLPDMKKR
jgi:exonuclease VII large subunit